jgi:mannose-6-phosphate isomerase class I
MVDPVAVQLPANQPAARFYRGGERIARFRHAEQAAPYTPEDWVASTVSVRGDAVVGLTTLPDGQLLRDAIHADPQGWLGARHIERYGADPNLLVKLLDAGQRLPVHAHPGGSFAREHLGTAHGKAEAWFILAPGVVHLGLTRDVARDELDSLVAGQDVESLISLLHEVEVAPGDRMFVPAGLLHAVGEGVLLVEVQEPEDLSILLEWRDFAIDGSAHGHLGLGFAKALTAVDHHALDDERLRDLIVRADGEGNGLPAAADEFFRLEEVVVTGSHTAEPGFMVLVGLDGDLDVEGVEDLRIKSGSTTLVPAAHGPLKAHGAGRFLIARPPAP